MTLLEVDKALDTLVIIYDTREQDTPRLRARLRQIESLCRIERAKIDYGDYAAKVMVDGEYITLPVTLERKMNLDEMCMCFCQSRKRFAREFERMKDANGKMYLLVENASWDAVYSGNYRSQMASRSLVASLATWLARYNCQLIFCSERITGKLIYDLFRYEAREMLQNMVMEGKDD